MKNYYSLVTSLLALVFVLYTSTPAQMRSSFVPDLDGATLVSDIIVESNTYSDMYDPGFTVYPGFPQQGLYTVISPKTGAIYCNLDADAEMEFLAQVKHYTLLI